MGSTSPPSGCVLESPELRRLAGHEALNVLKCSICWEFYMEPVILSCGHTFCFRCLLEMAKHAKRNNYRLAVHNIHIGCPNCRRPVYISAILSRKLTHNYPLTSIIESLRQRKLPEKVTRETNTEPMEPWKPETKKFDSTDDTKWRKNQHEYDERKLDVLTGNLDLVLRTLAANGNVLGDLSCAADIQEIVEEQQNKAENIGDDDYGDDRSIENDQESLEEHLARLDANILGQMRNTHISISSLFPSTSPEINNARPTASFHDPAIVSYALDSPASTPSEHFPPVGLFSFPGFGGV